MMDGAHFTQVEYDEALAIYRELTKFFQRERIIPLLAALSIAIGRGSRVAKLEGIDPIDALVACSGLQADEYFKARDAAEIFTKIFS